MEFVKRGMLSPSRTVPDGIVSGFAGERNGGKDRSRFNEVKQVRPMNKKVKR